MTQVLALDDTHVCMQKEHLRAHLAQLSGGLWLKQYETARCLVLNLRTSRHRTELHSSYLFATLLELLVSRRSDTITMVVLRGCALGNDTRHLDTLRNQLLRFKNLKSLAFQHMLLCKEHTRGFIAEISPRLDHLEFSDCQLHTLDLCKLNASGLKTLIIKRCVVLGGKAAVRLPDCAPKLEVLQFESITNPTDLNHFWEATCRLLLTTRQSLIKLVLANNKPGGGVCQAMWHETASTFAHAVRLSPKLEVLVVPDLFHATHLVAMLTRNDGADWAHCLKIADFSGTTGLRVKHLDYMFSDSLTTTTQTLRELRLRACPDIRRRNLLLFLRDFHTLEFLDVARNAQLKCDEKMDSLMQQLAKLQPAFDRASNLRIHGTYVRGTHPEPEDMLKLILPSEHAHSVPIQRPLPWSADLCETDAPMFKKHKSCSLDIYQEDKTDWFSSL